MFVIDGVDMTSTVAVFAITVFFAAYLLYIALYCCEEKDMRFADILSSHLVKGHKVRRRGWTEENDVMVLWNSPFGPQFFRGPYNGQGKVTHLSATDVLADDWFVAYDEIMELEPELDLIPQ